LRAKEFDLVLSGTVWNHPSPPHKQFFTRLAQSFRFFTYKRRMLDTYWAADFARVARQAGVPFATIDLRDPPFVYPWDLPLLQESFLYFKRELFFWPERSLGPLKLSYGNEVEELSSKLRPLSYGVWTIPQKVRDWAERDIDVFISGSMNPLRIDLIRRLRKFSGELKIEAYEGLITDAEYLEKMNRSKVVLCVESFGCETWRMYQAAATGCVPFVSWPYAQNAFPLEPEKHALYFSYIGTHFEDELRKAFSHPDRLPALGAAARAFVQQYKTRQALGSYVIETTLREFADRDKGQRAEVPSE
jgi:hypothetical protein